MKRYRRLLVALAAVASLFIVRATGLDRGLVDEVLDALVETLVEEPEPPAPPAGVQVPPSTGFQNVDLLESR